MASLSSSFKRDSLELLGNAPLPEFVNFDQKLSCSFCKKLLSEPMQLPCGHRMCKECCNQLSMQSVGSKMQCPSREEDCHSFSSTDIYPDYSALREVRQLLVFCTYRSFGCSETMPWQKLKKHVETCKFRNKTCSYCREEIPAELYQNHIDQDCRKVLLSCPYNCGDVKQMKRPQLENHKKSCRLKPQECKYKAVGCRFQGTGEVVTEHETDHKFHLDMVLQHLGVLNQQISSLKDSVQAAEFKAISLTATVATLVKEKSTLTANLQALEKELAESKEHQKQILVNQSQQIDSMTNVSNKLEQEFQLLQLKQSQQDTLLIELESSDPPNRRSSISLPEDMRQQFIYHDRTIALHDVRLAELDLRFQCLQTANYEGVLIWKIADYQKRKQEAIDGHIVSLYSQPFYTSRYGYKMCGRVYLNGDGIGKGTHLSLFFVVMQGDYDDILVWPFRQKVTLTLVDLRNNRRSISDAFRPDPASSSFQKPKTPMNVASGCPLFVKHSTLEDKDEVYLRNNTIYIKITVDTSELPCP